MSESGPQTSWPKPIVTRNATRLICTAFVPAPRLRPMAGKAGRYMSIAKGPTAVRRPRTSACRVSFEVVMRSLEAEQLAQFAVVRHDGVRLGVIAGGAAAGLVAADHRRTWGAADRCVVVLHGDAHGAHVVGPGARDIAPPQVAHVHGAARGHAQPIEGRLERARMRLGYPHLVGEHLHFEVLEQAHPGEELP